MEAPEKVADFPEELARKHLPVGLKDTCIVIPKRLLQWGGGNIMLIGLAIGFGLSALLVDLMPSSWLMYGFPLCLGIAWLISRGILEKEETKFYDAVMGSAEEQESSE